MARRGKKVYEQTERLGFRFKVPGVAHNDWGRREAVEAVLTGKPITLLLREDNTPRVPNPQCQHAQKCCAAVIHQLINIRDS